MQHIQLSLLLVSDNLFRQADICRDREKTIAKAGEVERREDQQKAGNQFILHFSPQSFH